MLDAYIIAALEELRREQERPRLQLPMPEPLLMPEPPAGPAEEFVNEPIVFDF